MNETYNKFAKIANKLITKLEKIKNVGKSKTPTDDIVTRSVVRSVIIGLGSKFPELTNKLNELEKFSFDSTDLSKLHSKGKLDMKLWVDKSIQENAEMAQSDITKIIDYSEKLQSMFNVNDNLEDWVKAKLNHACDYVATVRDYLKFYRDEKEAGTSDEKLCKKNALIKTINSRKK